MLAALIMRLNHLIVCCRQHIRVVARHEKQLLEKAPPPLLAASVGYPSPNMLVHHVDALHVVLVVRDYLWHLYVRLHIVSIKAEL